MRPRRLVRLALASLALAAVLAGLGARSALADSATVQLSLDNSSIAVGGSVTMTATVTNLLGTGTPTGYISFVNAAAPGSPLAAVGLSPTADPNTATAQFTESHSGLSAGTYSLYADYTPDFAAYFINLTSDVLSATQTLTVGSTTTTHDTQVVVTTPSLTVDSTTPVTLTATVSELGGTGTPSGTVSFADTISGVPIPLGSGSVTLVNGVAQLTVPDFAIGAHQIVASYSGGSGDNSSSSQPLLLSSQAPADTRVQTTTSVVVTPSQIAAGDTVTIIATIDQINASSSTAPPGGTVSFTSDSVFGNNVNLGSAALGSAPAGMTSAANQAIIQVGGWQTADYTITASYFGDVNDRDSAGGLNFSVLHGRSNTTIHYTGDTSLEYNHSATFAATITDGSGAPLSGRDVTFTLGAQTCHGTSDANGHASCSFVVAHSPSHTNVAVSVPQDINTQAANATNNVTVSPRATSISVGFVAGPPTTTLTATLLDDTGAPVTGRTVTLMLGAETCTAATDPTGVASCNVADETGPPVTLTATFAGESTYLSSTDSQTVTVSTGTVLTYTGATTGDFSDAATLSATLVDAGGNPVGGQSIGFSVGTQTCWTATTADGSATCQMTIAQPSGDYPVTVTFARHGIYLGSNDSSTFTVTPEQDTLTASAVAGTSASTVTATLLEDGVTPVAGRTVALALGTSTCSAVTDPSGVATCSVPTPPGQTSVPLIATFAGDTSYLPASYAGMVTLIRPTTLTYTGATTAHIHDVTHLSATLATASGDPVSSESVTLAVGSLSCQATTTAAGVASCGLLLLQPPGTYPITATFAGGDGYGASSDTSSFTILKEEVQVLVGVSGPILDSNHLTLRGVLIEDNLLPIANRTLTMTLGSQSCTGVTNFLGIASCTLSSAAPLGPTISTVSFAGDDLYLPVSRSAPAIVYAHAPGDGSFVIGDGSDEGAVMFWGSQWSKHNSLSDGKSPSSFKGYAGHLGDSSGHESSHAGDSSKPPSGPLPAYIDVMVASSVSKSDSTISVDTIHVVIVKTDPGYDGNPGHPGTGTVVATVS